MKQRIAPRPLSWLPPLALLAGALATETRAGTEPQVAGGEVERNVSHILLATQAEAGEVRAMILAAGGSRDAFRTAARAVSKDQVTKALGGDLGWVGSQSRIDQRNLQAAFEVPVGAVSQPVRSRFGWHLLFVTAQRGEGRLPAFDAGKDEAPKDGGKRPESDADAVAIINRYLKAIGGVDTLAAIKDRTEAFVNDKQSPTGPARARISLHQKRGGKLREEWVVEGFQIKNQGLEFAQGYDGDSGWVAMLGTVSDLEGRTLSVFVWDKHLDDVLAHWEANGCHVKSVGSAKVGAEAGTQVEARGIEVADFSGTQKARYYFSVKDHLLLKKSWVDPPTDKRDESTKEQYYESYAPVTFSDDAKRTLLVAHRLRIYADGVFDTERSWQHVAINTGLGDDLFARPEAAAPPGAKE